MIVVNVIFIISSSMGSPFIKDAAEPILVDIM